MHVVYLHQYFRTPSDSGGIRSYQFARALIERGHTVDVVTSRGRIEKGPAVEVIDGIRVHYVAVDYDNAMSNLRRMRSFAVFAARSCGVARRLRGDRLVATSTPLTIILPAMWASALRRTPLVFEVRDVWPEVPIAMGALSNPLLRGAALALERMAYRSAAVVIGLSDGMSASVRRRAPRGRRVETITNISDIERFDPRRADAEDFLGEWPALRGRPLVTYCGTFGRANDVGWLVDVAREARRRGSEMAFVVIGEGAEKAEVEKAAENAGVLGVNFFVGDQLAKSRLPGVLAATTVVLSLFADVPELQHNSANKFFDALAAHRPIAINYGGWQEERVNSTGAGIRLDRDPSRAADALMALIADPERLRRAGSAAGALADAYSLRALSTRFCDIVESPSPSR